MTTSRSAGTVASPEIAGGFVLVPVASLLHAWRSCRRAPLGIGDFRAWLALREMVARRRPSPAGRTAAYDHPELARLLGIAEKRARASSRRLVAAGLASWSGGSIEFPPSPDLAGPLDDTIGRGRGPLAIPRRLLRFLCLRARPALIATALAALLRCLSRRRAGFLGRGRLKATWIARAFGVDLRRVKLARRDLVGLGWIAPEPSGQWAENRWGKAYRIDLDWHPPAAAAGASSPPPPAAAGARTPPLDQTPIPSGMEKDQEPSRGDPPGVGLPGGRGIGGASLPAPTLRDVLVEDLRDTGRLLLLRDQAEARGLIGASEADRLRFVAAAEHALAVGTTNSPGLFFHLLRGRFWRYLTQGDEDRANARMKLQARGSVPSSSPGPGHLAPGGAVPAPSADALLVREVLAAVKRARLTSDPFAMFARLNPGWDRRRWDAALSEASGCSGEAGNPRGHRYAGDLLFSRGGVAKSEPAIPGGANP